MTEPAAPTMFTTNELINLRDHRDAAPVTKRLAAVVLEMQDAASMASYPSNMQFGHAIDAMKRGNRVCRAGWNGKGMWLVLVSTIGWDAPEFLMTSNIQRLPWIGMKTADNKFVPWLASQTDMLAEDWEIVS